MLAQTAGFLWATASLRRPDERVERGRKVIQDMIVAAAYDPSEAAAAGSRFDEMSWERFPPGPER